MNKTELQFDFFPSDKRLFSVLTILTRTNGELDQAINAMNYMIKQTDIVVSHFVIGSLHMIVNMLSD